MNQPRVLLMISSMRGGGSERQTLLLLNHLDRSRFEPHLFLLDRVGDLLAEVPADVRVHSFDGEGSAGRFYLPGRMLRTQSRYVGELIRRERIDLIYDRTFQMTLIAGPASRWSGTPRVSTVVSPPDRMLPPLAKRYVRLKRRRLAKAYRRAASVIAVSAQAARSAERYYKLADGSIQVVHNPVDCEAITSAANQGNEAELGRTTLVCVGRMTDEKGHADLLEALEISEEQWPGEANPLRVLMIGDGPLRKQLEQRWQRRDHRHEVKFLGHQPNPAPAIANADALVLPSRFEGMPNVVLEAMCLGTPVIATRSGGTVELERQEPTVLWAAPEDPQSLGAAILHFIRHRDEAAYRTEAAKRMLGEHHHVKATVRRIETLFQQALNQ